MTAEWTRALDEAGVMRLGELLAFKVRPGDVIALTGHLGSGKTTLARALIGALLHDAEVASPTFSLQQSYDTPRLLVTHYDFYRLNHIDEVLELGFEETVQNGAVLIEWPERARELLPADRLEIELAETPEPDVRLVTVRGLGMTSARAQRLDEIIAFLEGQTPWRDARIVPLQGDASTRSYARCSSGHGSVLLMDAPRQPDGPPIRDGKSYSKIAYLSEDMRSFTAIAGVLKEAGLSAPHVHAADLRQGLLLVEDFGDRLFATELARGTPQELLWRVAVDALLQLRSVPVPPALPVPDGTLYVLPRRDRAAFAIEIELLLDWLWPGLKGTPVPQAIRNEFLALWSPVLDRLLGLSGGWFLRDYHSPNLIWLPNRIGIQRVGIIDFQDALNEHFAFDLVSLLQDARVHVPQALERELFDYYCERVEARERSFDRAEFSRAYADFGAQRNTRLLGLWARLLKRDGKPRYMRLMPSTWEYLLRNLGNPSLAELRAWYDRHFPPSLRTGELG